ncbi:MAG: hypothetical protein JXR34_11405 [Bacteroidales bacterium]|nr:hypothetical protein [Bacteroidales bacterium]
MLFRKNYLRIFLFIITVIAIWIAVSSRWSGEKWQQIVQADGRGYYGHLPAAFIYDFTYSFHLPVEIEKLEFDYVYIKPDKNGNFYNKYYVGTAVLQAPFFLIAHGVSYLADKPMDGYSKLYFKFFHLGGIFYLILGLWFLAKFLRNYSTNILHILLTLTFVYYGTNLFYYSLYESSLSHLYSFTLFSAFAYFAHRFYHNFRPWQIVVLGFLMGLIVIVRPINAIVILSLPLIAGSKETFFNGFKRLKTNPLMLSAGLLTGIAVIFIQLLEYKLGTGNWWIFSYTNESGFNWSGAHIIPFLFSYKKGLFLYTPMYLLIIFLSFKMLKINRFQFISWLFFVFVSIYVLSAWWQWWYGGSFSSRVMVEYLPFFALALILSFEFIKNMKIKGLIIGLLSIFTVICVIQTIQFHYGLIHFVDMDKDWYWRVFLKIP